MADMDKLMEFLQKEVPSNARDLNDAINNLFEVIEHTRTALKTKLSTMANDFFEDSDYNEIIKEFQNANKQLRNFKSNLNNFVNDDKKNNSNIGISDDILIEENDTGDIAEDEEEEIEEIEGKIDYKKYLVDNTKPYPLSYDFENTTPDSFSFRGETYKVKTYKDMLLKLCEILYEKDANAFKEIATWHQIRGRKKSYIVYESDKVAQTITNPLRFLNTKIILEGTTSTTQKIKIIHKMLEIYKISPSSIKVYLKSDRHPKHGQEPIGIYKDRNYDYKAEIALYLKNEKIDSSDFKSGIRISQLAYDYFQNYFKNEKSTYDIHNFLDKDWCKSVLNISYPLLKEYNETKPLKEQTIPDDKTNPYYAQNPQIYINGKKYLIYIKWNEKMHRSKLEKWIFENPIPNSLEKPKINIYILPKNKIKICGKCWSKTQLGKLLVTCYKGNENFQRMLHVRRCDNCDLIYMSEETLKMYKDTSDKLDASIDFIEKDT